MKQKEFLETPLGEKVEHQIRYALGQRLKGSDLKHTNHLRFNMSGERDSIDGFYNNLNLLNLFNFPVTLIPSYSHWDINYYKNYKFGIVFHKGVGSLIDNNEDCILDFNGLGTVDIIIELVLFFNNFDNFIKCK
jgi:hypothetical protein